MTISLMALAVSLTVASPETYTVDPGATSVRYRLRHKLHEVDGRSTSIEAKAVVQGDGKVLAMVRIPVSSFDSGDANRDAHMREALESGKHPFVVFKGLASLAVPAPRAKPIPVRLDGQLDFHGVNRNVEVPATVEFGPDGSATVRGKISVSLDAYRIERPSLLFVKVDDDCAIEFSLRLRRER